MALNRATRDWIGRNMGLLLRGELPVPLRFLVGGERSRERTTVETDGLETTESAQAPVPPAAREKAEG